MARTRAGIGKRLARIAFVERKHVRQRMGALFTPTGEKHTTLVCGVQRSGTEMLMHILERSNETDVYRETDRRAFSHYNMRPPTVMRHLIEKSCVGRIVVKALLESDKTAELLQELAPAKAIWMVRHYDDVVNSCMQCWPGDRNHIGKIIVDRNAAGWRGRGMSDETHALLREYYHPDMDDSSALALFWYYRNQLLFDQKLEEDPRLLILRYEPLVQFPEKYGPIVARFVGIAFTPAMMRLVFSDSVRKRPPPNVEPRIRALCDPMLNCLTLLSQRIEVPDVTIRRPALAPAMIQ
jgi:hypothetical protein